MASGNTIIIGGGIAGASPFTIGQFPVIVLTDPKTVTDGNIRQDTSTPPKVFIGDSTYTAGATVIGGGTTNLLAQKSIVIGDAASYLPAGYNYSGVVIGRNATAIGFGGAIVIGHAAVSTGPNGDLVLIGRGATTSVDSGVTIGSLASCSSGGQSIAIGFQASTAGNLSCIAIGYQAAVSGGAGVGACVVLGGSSGTNKTRNTILGTGIQANIASDNLILGTTFTQLAGHPNNSIGFFNSAGYTTLIVGRGDTVAVSDGLLFRLTDGLGNNIAAGSLTIRGGNATGAGAQSSINFQTQSAAGAAAVLGTMTTQVQIVPSTGAAGQANLRVNNVTTGAGVAAGTLLNAPTAGDPVFWLPINIAGNIRYIPCWA